MAPPPPSGGVFRTRVTTGTAREYRNGTVAALANSAPLLWFTRSSNTLPSLLSRSAQSGDAQMFLSPNESASQDGGCGQGGETQTTRL